MHAPYRNKLVHACSFLQPHVCIEGERQTRRGQSSLCRAPQPKGQLSTAGGGKTTGCQSERLGKRTSQGRFQLAQRVVAVASHRGREEEEGRKQVGTETDRTEVSRQQHKYHKESTPGLPLKVRSYSTFFPAFLCF